MQGFRGPPEAAWHATLVLVAPVLAIIVIGFLTLLVTS
jgi:hypothetical protein